MNDTNQAIIQAIDTIVDNRLKMVNFDSTIVCEIVAVSESEPNAYTVSSGTNLFTAYSEEEFKEKQKVFVTIPQNDYSQKKLITGRYTASKYNQYGFTNPFDAIISITGNLIDDTNNQNQLTLEANGDAEFSNTLQNKTSFDQISIPLEYGSPRYIGVKAVFTTKMPNVTRGDYGLRINFYQNDSEDSPVRAIYLASEDFYGNPYYYDSGFEVQTLFPYPTDVSFNKCKIQLYQNNNFNFENINETKTIKASNIELCFAYDQNDFPDAIFNIATSDDSRSYSSDGEIKDFRATLIDYTEETSKFEDYLSDTSLKEKTYITWFRYNPGNGNLGANKQEFEGKPVTGGAHWEPLFEYDDSKKGHWFESYGTNNLKINRLMALYELLEQKKLEDSSISSFENTYLSASNSVGQIEYSKNENEIISSLTYREENLMITSKEQLINHIETPLGSIINNQHLFIGKTTKDRYRRTILPSTEYQNEQIKAIVTYTNTNNEQKNFTSNIITFEKVVNTKSEGAEARKYFNLSLENGDNVIYLNYGKDYKLLTNREKVYSLIVKEEELTKGNIIPKKISWKIPAGAQINIIDDEKNPYYTITNNIDFLIYTHSFNNNQEFSNGIALQYTLGESINTDPTTLHVYCYIFEDEDQLEYQAAYSNFLLQFGCFETSPKLYILCDGQEIKSGQGFTVTADKQEKNIQAILKNQKNEVINPSGSFSWSWVYPQNLISFVDNRQQQQTINTDNGSNIISQEKNDKINLIIPALSDWEKNIINKAILKVSYVFSISLTETKTLEYCWPIALTDIEKAEEISGPLEVAYDSSGQIAYYDNKGYSLKDRDGNQITIESISLQKEEQNIALPTLSSEGETIAYKDISGGSWTSGDRESHQWGFLVRSFHAYQDIFNPALQSGDKIFVLYDSEFYKILKSKNQVPVPSYGVHFIGDSQAITIGTFTACDEKEELETEYYQGEYYTKVYYELNIDNFNAINTSPTASKRPSYNNYQELTTKRDGVPRAFFVYLFFSEEKIDSNKFINNNNDRIRVIPKVASTGTTIKPNLIAGVYHNYIPWVTLQMIKTNENTSQKERWEQPLYIYYRDQQGKFLNNWNEQISLDDNQTKVFSAHVALGEFEENNKFSGLIMGKLGDEKSSDFGLYGFKTNSNTFSLTNTNLNLSNAFNFNQDEGITNFNLSEAFTFNQEQGITNFNLSDDFNFNQEEGIGNFNLNELLSYSIDQLEHGKNFTTNEKNEEVYDFSMLSLNKEKSNEIYLGNDKGLFYNGSEKLINRINSNSYKFLLSYKEGIMALQDLYLFYETSAQSETGEEEPESTVQVFSLLNDVINRGKEKWENQIIELVESFSSESSEVKTLISEWTALQSRIDDLAKRINALEDKDEENATPGTESPDDENPEPVE